VLVQIVIEWTMEVVGDQLGRRRKYGNKFFIQLIVQDFKILIPFARHFFYKYCIYNASIFPSCPQKDFFINVTNLRNVLKI